MEGVAQEKKRSAQGMAADGNHEREHIDNYRQPEVHHNQQIVAAFNIMPSQPDGDDGQEKCYHQAEHNFSQKVDRCGG